MGGKTYEDCAHETGPHRVVWNLPPSAVVEDDAGVETAADEVDHDGDENAEGNRKVRFERQDSDFEISGMSSYIMPKTPPGPRGCSATSTPPQAVGERDSKKYVHSSIVPTKLIVTFGPIRSRSHMSETIADFRRMGALLAPAWLSLSSSSSSRDCDETESLPELESRSIDLLANGVAGHGDPPV